MTQICVRKFRPEDENQVQALIIEATKSTLWPFWWKTTRKETTAQLTLMLSALCFVGFGLPLQYCLFTYPLMALIILVGVWIGHHVKTRYHQDMDNIYESYLSQPRTCFWVAEVLHQGDGGKCSFVEDDNAVQGSGRIVGTLALGVKKDPDMKEPPNSVAWIRRMAVAKPFQRKGIGEFMLDVAIRHCFSNHFRAIELLTTECHDAARNLYFKRGFEIINCRRQLFAAGLADITLYTLRMPCVASSVKS